MQSLYSIADCLGLIRPDCPDIPITSLAYDSRQAKAGSLYFAFSGLHCDGEDYIKDAIAHGAVAVVASRETAGVPTLLAPKETIRRLYARASAFFFSYPSERIMTIGITGTDGKTSTSYYTKQLIELMGKRCGISSTVYCDAGDGLVKSPFHNTTPEAYDVQAMLSKAVEHQLDAFVLESSSHALSAEYARLEGTTFAASAYTRITSEHLEFHKTRDAYIEAKLNLARNTKGPVFAYSGNAAERQRQDICKDRLRILHPPKIISRSIEGLDFIYKDAYYHLPFFADFALENAFMAAQLASFATGSPLEEVLGHLGELANPAGRQEIIRDRGRTLVIDFAHTPDAFDRLFAAFRAVQPTGAFICIFGASGERDKSKRADMGRMAARHCTLAVLSADDPRGESVRDICLEIEKGFQDTECRHIIIEDRKDAIGYAISHSAVGDTIFLLGIGRQGSLDYSEGAKVWDERAVALEALGRLV